MAQLLQYVDFDGVIVPEGDDHRYYDWKLSTPNKLVELHSPFSKKGFCIGSSMVYFIFDFAVMPDGRAVLDIPPHRGGRLPNPWDFFHAEDMYNLQYAHQAVEAAYYLVDKALNGLRELGVEHCDMYHRADPWFFMRAVGHTMKVKPFVSMTKKQLHSGL
jgi:hypothetical protein